MRKLVLFTIFLSISFLLKAQAHEGSVEYNKGKQACIVMEYNYPAEAVENAMRAKLLKLGYGGKEEKGMMAYTCVRSAVVPACEKINGRLRFIR